MLQTNKTYKYFFPCLKYFGSDFTFHVNSVEKEGLFLFIEELRGILKLKEESVFLVIKKTSYNIHSFSEFMKGKEYFVKMYSLTNSFVFQISIPLVLKPKFYNFLLGNYSKMYSEEEYKNYFNSMKNFNLFFPQDKKINSDDLITKVNNFYGTNIEKFTDEIKELDIPPCFEREIMNYKGYNNSIINFNRLKEVCNRRV